MLRDLYEGEATDIRAQVTALAARVACWRDEALGLVEPDRRDGEAGAVARSPMDMTSLAALGVASGIRKNPLTCKLG